MSSIGTYRYLSLRSGHTTLEPKLEADILDALTLLYATTIENRATELRDTDPAVIELRLCQAERHMRLYLEQDDQRSTVLFSSEGWRKLRDITAKCMLGPRSSREIDVTVEDTCIAPIDEREEARQWQSKRATVRSKTAKLLALQKQGQKLHYLLTSFRDRKDDIPLDKAKGSILSSLTELKKALKVWKRTLNDNPPSNEVLSLFQSATTNWNRLWTLKTEMAQLSVGFESSPVNEGLQQLEEGFNDCLSGETGFQGVDSIAGAIQTIHQVLTDHDREIISEWV